MSSNSDRMKEWCKNNPEKHTWKRKGKFISPPCNKVKEFLKENSINFIEEYQPLTDRFFSIDIAFPDKKIGIEINGNQHYEKFGVLKQYYQERHDLIVNAGWQLHEIHYSLAYNNEFLKCLLHTLKNNIELNYDYSSYIIKQKKEYRCLDCNSLLLWNTSKRCDKCSKLRARKVERPDKEELLKLVWEIPLTILAKKFNISDVGIKKWCKCYNIPTPPRGYWAKFKSGLFDECNQIKENLLK